MYLIKENKRNEIQKYKTSYYADKIGITKPHMSSVLNRTKCSEIIAKSILSVYFNISLTDDKMEELLKEYFEEE